MRQWLAGGKQALVRGCIGGTNAAALAAVPVRVHAVPDAAAFATAMRHVYFNALFSVDHAPLALTRDRPAQAKAPEAGEQPSPRDGHAGKSDADELNRGDRPSWAGSSARLDVAAARMLTARPRPLQSSRSRRPPRRRTPCCATCCAP
jgi:hypothetical protein